MGRPEMAEKWRNPATHRGGRRSVGRPDPGASRAVGRETWLARLPSGGTPPL